MKQYCKDKLWFTADLHYYHRNIIKYCNRPFESVEDMNHTLIKRWNSLIKDDDDVFVLGDMVFGGYDKWVEILSQLKGKIHLIVGNHDPEKVINRLLEEKYLESVSQMELIDVGEQKIFVCHYPMISWPHKEQGVWDLHGHVHLLKNTEDFSILHYDVGVDHNTWFPISYTKLKEIMSKNENCEHI